MAASRPFALFCRQGYFRGRFLRPFVAVSALIVSLVQLHYLLRQTQSPISGSVVVQKPPESNPSAFNSHHPSVSPMVESHVDDIIMSETPRCHCVRCCDDELCGGLWAGSIGRKQGDTSRLQKISLVIAHCLHDLSWLEDYVRGYVIHDIVIYSKCGMKPVGAPPQAIVVNVTNNVGRNDQTFAQHMVRVLDTHRQDGSGIADENNAVIFLKDTRSPVLGRWRPFGDMLRIISVTGFACGMELTVNAVENPLRRKKQYLLLSAYHRTNDIDGFRIDDYQNNKYTNPNEQPTEPFKSKYANLSDWIMSIPFAWAHNPALVEVCYGGSFGTTLAAIRKHPQTSWESLSRSLSRSDNLEEGHFAERTWARLLAKPIEPYQVEALLQYLTQSGPATSPGYFRGALAFPAPKSLAHDQWTFLEKCGDKLI